MTYSEPALKKMANLKQQFQKRVKRAEKKYDTLLKKYQKQMVELHKSNQQRDHQTELIRELNKKLNT